MKESISENSAVCVDAGTTNTRVWLVEGERVLTRATAQVGVRDTARDGSPRRLQEALRDLIRQVCDAHPSAAPQCVIAAGMVTSSLGIAEVPHLRAPAGRQELAAATAQHRFAEITDLPVLLVPGVRCGPENAGVETIGEVDVMRGEETLCIGLWESGTLGADATLINLGSHWKAVRLDDGGRITSSVTLLTGELIHAVQTQTILASAVGQERPEVLNYEWQSAGMREQRRAGLERALFCVRLLEQAGRGGVGERLSYLIGAFIASSLDALRRSAVLAPNSSVVLTGGGAVAQGWVDALREQSFAAKRLTTDETEQALLGGLRSILRSISL